MTATLRRGVVSLVAERSRILRAALSCLVVASTVVARPAQAQTVTLPATTQPTRRVPLRPSDEDPYWVSYHDCMANDAYTFQTALSGYQGYRLEVWAGPGAECSDIATRTGSAPVCWKVYAAQPYVTNWPVTIRVRDMIGMHTPVDVPSGPGSGTVADCAPQATSAPQELLLTFMLVDSRGALPSGETDATYLVTYDLAGPTPPSGVTAGLGGGELVVNWTPSADPDLIGYHLYCDPLLNGVLDAGSDASGAEAGITNPDCPSTELIEGARPPADYLCGSIAGQANHTASVAGLAQDTLYAVGVAGYDVVHNAGPLSNIACFFDKTRSAGAGTSGGDCDIGGAPQPGEPWALGGVLFAIAFRRRRRRISRRRASVDW